LNIKIHSKLQDKVYEQLHKKIIDDLLNQMEKNPYTKFAVFECTDAVFDEITETAVDFNIQTTCYFFI